MDMIVSQEDMRKWLVIDEYDAVTEMVHEGVEAAAKDYKDIDIISTDYTELYDGEGGPYLFLNNRPVTAVSLVSIDFEDVIKIRNTSSDASNAYFTISSTGVTLVVDGGTNEDTTTVAFSSYATLTTLVAAIVAVGKGWECEMMDSDYDSLESTGLLQILNVYCGAYGGSTASWEYMYHGAPLTEYKVKAGAGYIYYSAGFTEGVQNVLVSYTAGYTAATMPANYKEAVMEGVKAILDRRSEGGMGVTSFSDEGYSVKYQEDMLNAIFAQYLGAPGINL